VAGAVTCTTLLGHSILVVEDHFVIAADIAASLRDAGATVMTARSLSDGLRLAGDCQLSAAVVDFRLGDGDGTALCELLNRRSVPFVLHTGRAVVDEACRRGVVVSKPASAHHIVVTIKRLLRPAAAQ
jgi:DNA-binding response OmpR family regulator